MRARHKGWPPPYALHPAIRYPTRSDRHPIYQFGHFGPDEAIVDPYAGLNDAILGIREAALPVKSTAGHTHLLHNQTVAPIEHSGAFMFGTDPEQPRVMPWGEQGSGLGTP